MISESSALNVQNLTSSEIKFLLKCLPNAKFDAPLLNKYLQKPVPEKNALYYFLLGIIMKTDPQTHLEGIAHFHKSLELDPEFANTYVYIGIELILDGKNAESEAYVRKGLELDPRNRTALYALGSILEGCNRIDEAEMHYRKACKIDPKFAGGFQKLAQILSSKRNYAEAEPFARKAIDLQPGFNNNYLGLGEILSGQNKYAEAIPFFQKSLELDPENVLANWWMGQSLRMCGKLTEAEKYLQIAIEANPEDSKLIYLLGLVLFDQRNYEEAEKCMQKAVELHLSYESAAFLGAALAYLGKLEEAMKYLNMSIALNPNYDFAHIILSQLFFSREEWEESIKHFQKATALNPENCITYKDLGENLKMQGMELKIDEPMLLVDSQSACGKRKERDEKPSQEGLSDTETKSPEEDKQKKKEESATPQLSSFKSFGF